MNIIVRKAVPEDAESMARVVCSSWKYAYKGIVSQRYLDNITYERWASKFHSGISDGADDYFVMEQDNNAIDAAFVRHSQSEDFPDDAELVCFYLLPEFIGKGMGQQFFNGILKSITEKGYTHMVLDVLSENSRAISFYKKQGFASVNKSIEVTLENNTYICDMMRMSFSL